MVGEFNRELLLTARHLRGVNQKELAAEAGISQTYLSKLENGVCEATEQAVEALARALDFPVGFFYQNVGVWGLPLSVHPIHRKKKRASIKSLDRLRSEISLRLIHIKKFLEAVDLDPDFELPRIEPEDFNYDFERIADTVRRAWLLPPGPVENLIEYLELAGIIVIHADFQDSDIDALNIDAPGLPPCIFLNKNQPADRMRFSAAHELGHLVMHSRPDEKMEKQADLFASAFLMPKQDINRYFVGRIDLKHLAQLKPIWGVAMAALLVRASQIKAITEWQSKNLWQQMSARGYRKREPVDIAMENPKLFPEIIRLHLEELEYTPHEMANLLLTNEKDLFHLYGLGASPKRSSHLVVVPR